MKKIFALLASAVALLAFATPGCAQTVLRVANWLPPNHPLVVNVIKPWTEQVGKATDGRVVMQVLDAPLGPPAAHFDFAVNGIADVTYGVHNYTPGRFTATLLAELPFQSEKSERISVAYWRVHQQYLAKANEHRGTQVLSVFTHGAGQLWARGRNLTSMASIKGSKIRVGGGFAQDVAEALGVVPIQAPVTDAYQILSGGVADGIEFPVDSIVTQRLDGVLDQGLLVPGGLYNVSFFVVMNAARWNQLPQQDRDAIQSVSGEHLARKAGQYWDRADAAGLNAIKQRGKIKVVVPDAPQMAALRKALEAQVDKTLQQIAAKGVNAQAAHQALRREIAAENAKTGS
jgi:TRAP-type C4-dicarboxylate transport system substrate-binding protein